MPLDAMAAEVVLLVKSAIAPLQEKIAVLDARVPITGPMGEPGQKGDPGPTGSAGPAGQIPVEFEGRIAALEAAAPHDVAPADLAASLAGLLTKELSALTTPVRTQKRIAKDGDGGYIVTEEQV